MNLDGQLENYEENGNGILIILKAFCFIPIRITREREAKLKKFWMVDLGQCYAYIFHSEKLHKPLGTSVELFNSSSDLLDEGKSIPKPFTAKL